jgi:hypothetical protein
MLGATENSQGGERMRYLVSLAACGLIFGSAPSLWAGRTMLSLDGEWEFVKVRSLDEPIPTSGWQKISIPGTLNGYDYERAWFRKKINIPREWQGSRLILRFGGVKYNSRVLVNGKNVGGCFNGYDAFELDITDSARFGMQNEILVGCHDWTGVFLGEKVDFAAAKGNIELREVPQDRIISPIGGHFSQYGIWNSVYLLALPSIYIKEALISPSIRQSRIRVDMKIVNMGNKNETITIKGDIYRWDGKERDKTGQWGVKGKPVASMVSGKIEISPGETHPSTLVFEKPPLDPWSPYSPDLYVLELKVDRQNGDLLRERFGYRELWTQDGDFYLNGKKVHLLASSWWPPTQGVSREYVLEQLGALKKMNAVAFRTHTQPWQDIFYEVADEIGIMMIPEGAVWNDDTSYRVFDPKFWENYAKHLRSMVHHLYNHPSVVMWSLENEFYGSRVNERIPETEENLARMGRIVKEEDPTRPITYESDGDPGGIADVIGIHYPNEFPQRRLWPNDAYWLEEPRYIYGGGGMFWRGPFLWDHKKPLYIGEYLWAPARDPSANTLFFGDESYKDLTLYRTKAKALAWRMQILAYRHYDVSGHSPWTVIEQGPLDERNPCWVAQRDMYRPLAAFIKEYDSRFFSGETIQRTVWLFNDTMRDLSEVEFKWALLDGEKILQQGGETLSMKSGASLEKVIRLSLPRVDSRKKLMLMLTLEAQDATPFKEGWTIEVFPSLSKELFPQTQFEIYDPKDKLAPILKEIGVSFRRIENLGEWNGKDILVIAPQALEGEQGEPPVVGKGRKEEKLLSQMVEEGGRVLVLEQSRSAGDWLPITLDDQSSTFSFPQLPTHPILRDIKAEELRWWRGDNIVSENEPIRPMQAGALSLVATGAADGLSHSPLVEVRQGKGVWLICQLKVASKLDSEPIAGVLLGRMLDYLMSYSPPKGEALSYASPQFEEKLHALRLAFRSLKDWSELRYPDVQLFIVQADEEEIADHLPRIVEFLEAGGRVLWHRPKPEDLAKLSEISHLAFSLQPYKGPILRTEGEGTLLPFITREDLYWLGPSKGAWWETAPLATDAADGVFIPTVTIENARRYPAIKGVRLERQVGIQGNELVFWSYGRAEWEIELPETGNYNLGVVARGTPVGGIYPLCEIYLDEERIGVLYIGSEETRTYICSFKAKAGKHLLAIAFVNDAYSPPEDRNLWIEGFLIAKGKEEEEIEVLTSPPALLSLPVGKGLLVLNAIRWDEPPAGNGIKARRFISSLLNGLGATSIPHAKVTILKAEMLRPVKEYPLLQRGEGYIALATNATLESDIEVAKEGTYRITILARGTALGGIYPIVTLEIDKKEVGRLECKGEEWSPHSLIVRLPAGKHNFRLSFINDEWKPPEDRNLWISRVEFEELF